MYLLSAPAAGGDRCREGETSHYAGTQHHCRGEDS